MASKVVQKQWPLRESETLNSFIVWRENLKYILSLDDNFDIFLQPGATWQKSSGGAARGLTDDPGTVTVNRRTKEKKCIHLNLFLGQIANFATIVSRNEIVNNSTCLADVWNYIRSYYGFQETGSRFLDLSSLTLRSEERPEALYQRILSFFDDNLLSAPSSLTHHGVAITQNETRSPTIENTIVWLWLEKLHVGLPGLVKQKYGSELRNKTLASIKPEISSALDSLLSELRSSEDSKVLRMQSPRSFSPARSTGSSRRFNNNRNNNRSCCLCQTAGLPSNTHFLSQCQFLPEADKRRMSKVRFVETDEEVDDNDGDMDDDTCDNSLFVDAPVPTFRRVSTRKFPMMDCFYKHFPVRLCLDSGAESSLVSERFACHTNMKIERTRQGALQADSKTPLNIIGEISVNLKCRSHTFKIDALVTKEDIGDMIAGEPCLELNDIAIRPSKKQIILKGRDVIPYSSL